MTPQSRLPRQDFPNDQRVLMYDTITPGRLPAAASVVVGYVDGRWPSYERLLATHRTAVALSVATSHTSQAMILDVENGDATSSGALEWLTKQRLDGVNRPCLYMSVGAVRDFVMYATAHGHPRGSYRLWTAHWSGTPHICSRACGLGDVEPPGATQWKDATAEGFDVSVTTWGWVRAVYGEMYSE